MSRSSGIAAFATVLLAMGCASNPEEAPSAASATAADETAAVSGSGAPTVVNLNEIPQDTPASRVICREILLPGSNVLERLCMTEEDWGIYERHQALRAQEMLRAIQQGRYR